MNTKSTHIVSSVKNHYGAFGGENETNPISKIDAEIVRELADLLYKVNVPEVNIILKDYKKIGDSHIIDELIGLNTQITLADGGEKEEKKLPYWIHFNDTNKTRVVRSGLLSFSEKDGVGENEAYFGIIINQTAEDTSKVPMYADTELLYPNEEERELDMQQLEDLNNY